MGTKSMTSKERVLTAFAGREPDRVPVNYDANSGIDARLKAHFKLDPKDGNGLRDALGVDFRGANAGYAGPRLHAEIPDRHVGAEWGERRRWVAHGTGGYWDFCDFPLEHASDDVIARWPMPSPDAYAYAHLEAYCRANRNYALSVGGPGLGDIINSTGFVFGMEETLVRLATGDPALLAFLDRRLGIVLEVTRRTLEAARGGIDFMWMGEDLGTQIAPMISLDMYRTVLRPRHQRFVDLATSFNIPVMIHTCGSSSWAYEDFVEMGIRVVDTLQPEAANMSPRHLKDTFGGRLAFHGCISTAGPVAFGTVDETVADCRQTLAIMMPGGGYCFAPTHALQDNSPTENVVAMYETARRDGRY
jgi:uroporphyrinogen decarboxylase